MNWLDALLLGLVQGLTEFLPVSSSGHLELGRVLLNIDTGQNLEFTVVVHGATVLSIIVVFFSDIRKIFIDSLKFQWNESVRYLAKILVSMIPVGLVGLFLRDRVASMFTGNILLVGSMLIVTAMLLVAASLARKGDRNIPFLHALVIGIAQALAVVPGISRSGATIATGLLLGNKRAEVTRFSFLMVLLPIIAVNAMDLLSGDASGGGHAGALVLATGFVAAFVSGLIACRWMLSIVRKGKLVYFGIYCFIAGAVAVLTAI